MAMQLPFECTNYHCYHNEEACWTSSFFSLLQEVINDEDFLAQQSDQTSNGVEGERGTSIVDAKCDAKCWFKDSNV